MTATASQTARHFNITRRTLRRWREQGCPVASQRPLRFDLVAVARWRDGEDRATRTGQALLDVIVRDALDGQTAPEVLQIPRCRAAALLCQAFDRLHPNVSTFPEPVRQLRRLAGADTEMSGSGY